MPEAACAESSDLSIAFLPGSGYNQTIDSNGAVGHLLTRSVVSFNRYFAGEAASFRVKIRDQLKYFNSSKE